MGDFNIVRNLEKKNGGNLYHTQGMDDFNNCFFEVDIDDIPYEGVHLT